MFSFFFFCRCSCCPPFVLVVIVVVVVVVVVVAAVVAAAALVSVVAGVFASSLMMAAPPPGLAVVDAVDALVSMSSSFGGCCSFDFSMLLSTDLIIAVNHIAMNSTPCCEDPVRPAPSSLRCSTWVPLSGEGPLILRGNGPKETMYYISSDGNSSPLASTGPASSSWSLDTKQLGPEKPRTCLWCSMPMPKLPGVGSSRIFRNFMIY